MATRKILRSSSQIIWALSSSLNSQLFDHLTHNLNDDSSLIQIEDIDLNYIVLHCKPLVLSTEAQLEEAWEKEMQSYKANKTKAKSGLKKNNNK